MSIVEENKIDKNNFEQFGEAMLDGRLTSLFDGRCNYLQEAILFSQQLDRPLSLKEMKQFEV